ncbi:type II toxin-antitoxin system HicB family antitoxin [uncultured Methanofollis sp.]|uniref:type II toxin-antitoxin system HicB family antitoxin n=1 Tax=uncultured Methanofollis sp. TaxID=262500 RepID=UPI0026375459|nr:type II toxin-antitoxin system HicB family antitoxin [uncultured Methanofollis sp.]
MFYSDEDEGFIAVVPELPGCSAFGVTEEDALEEVKVAIELWLATAHQEGREIPVPSGRERLKDLLMDEGARCEPRETA